MLATVRERAPKARITGLPSRRWSTGRTSQELIVGIGEDAAFGPILLFGHGGTAVEVISDRAIGLPPLNLVLAREMIARTRISKLLAGYRDRPPADIDAIARTLVQLSQLLIDLPEIAELDINPLLAGPDGVLALDARVAVRPPGMARRRPAIEPYPSGLEHEIEIDDGLRLLVRPIRPEDEAAAGRDGGALVSRRTSGCASSGRFAIFRIFLRRGSRRSTTTARWRSSRSTTRTNRATAKSSACRAMSPTRTTSAPSSRSWCAPT